MRTTLIACAVATAALLVSSAAAPQLASADDKMDRARSHYQRGVQLFNEASYKAAIAEFAAADGIAPSPILEYNMALCYDRLGERDEALRRYRLYLKRVPSANNRSVVEGKIARLEKAIRDESVTKPEPDKPSYETLPENPEVDNHNDGGGDLVPPPGKPAPPKNPDLSTNKTGDPELDRVAGIDVASIRDERGIGGTTAPPPPTGGNNADNPPPPPVQDPGDRPKPKPIYKRWWFWVVVGVSAIILIDIASSGGNDDTAARVFDPSLDQRFGGMSRSEGLTIRF